MADLVRLFRLLNFEQRVAAVGAVLLAISTFGPFSFVEVAEITIAIGVLALLRARALGKRFHLPFGDGTVIAAAERAVEQPHHDQQRRPEPGGRDRRAVAERQVEALAERPRAQERQHAERGRGSRPPRRTRTARRC